MPPAPPPIRTRSARSTERTLANSSIRQRTGATVVALETGSGEQKERILNPSAETPLQDGDRLILVGAPEAEDRFLTGF